MTRNLYKMTTVTGRIIYVAASYQSKALDEVRDWMNRNNIDDFEERSIVYTERININGVKLLVTRDD